MQRITWSQVVANKPPEKIKLHAIFTKDGKFAITDQDGREFKISERTYNNLDGTFLNFELEAPHDLWRDRPRVNLTFSIPLQAEEEMPTFIQEMIREKIGNFLG